jgi:SNF2 family DNA or RNA helicase
MSFRTYGTLTHKPKNAGADAHWLMTSLEPHVSIRLKHIFPKIEKTQTDNFVFSDEPITCTDLDWFLSRYPMKISDEDILILKGGRSDFEKTQAELERILLPDYKPKGYQGLNPGKSVRPYQSQAVDILMHRKSLLLGDLMGLGKTVTAIAAMLQPGVLPAAVIVQTHLQGQWKEKLSEFSGLKVHLITKTTPYSLPEADVYIFKYTQLAGWVSIFATKFFKMAIYDEIQELRTGSASAKGAGAYQLSDNVQYRLGLSGTPIHNYGSEIFNVLKAIDPTVLGNERDFLREWTTDGKKVDDAKALGTYLRECHVFLRRTQEDVGQQLPPINRIVEIVDTNQKVLDDMNKLAKVLAMKVVSGSFAERGQAARELDIMARQATGVAKATSVAAYVRILLESGIPVVLAGWHREVYDIWLRELAEFKPVMYTGSENSAAKKQKSVDAFMSGETNLFIISMRSGAGLDGLQARASFIVFGELDWSGQTHDQLIARLYREGQPDTVTAIFLQAEEGSDPPMIDLLGLKASQARGIVDPNAAFKTTHSDLSRVKALCSQFLSRAEAKSMNDIPDVYADTFKQDNEVEIA